MLLRTTPADQGRIKLPVLAPHLQFHIIDEQQTLLFSETFNTLLHGKLYADLLPLLDGTRQQDAIVAALGATYSAADVLSAIVALSTKSYAVSAEHGMQQPRAAYWSSLGASPRMVEQRLARSRVALEGDGKGFVQHLTELGVRLESNKPTLRVILCEDYLADGFAEMNRNQLETGAAWILVRPYGIEPLFGPVFRADDEGPCWECLSHRLRGHQEVHTFLRNFAGEDAAFKPFAAEPVVLSALYRLIAAEIAKWLVLDALAPIHEHAITLHLGTLDTSRHRVVRRPQCPACGDQGLHRPGRAPVPLLLRSSPKRVLNSGGARALAPEVTLAKYRHLVSPVSGVVSWLRRTTDDDDAWLHVYWAGSNLGIRSRTLSSLRRSLRSKSAGKGSTRAQSEVSALCEAVERYSGSFHGDERRVRKRFNELALDDEAIHPNDVQLFSEHQFAHAETINAKGHPYNVIPQPLDPDAELDWTPVWSLTEGRHRLLPTTMLYSMPAEVRGAKSLIADSNGCAAGNTLEEAILQGFYELVERDAFAIWWYNRLRAPAIDLASFDDQYLAGATDYYRRYERDLWMLDITSDLDIPTFVAVSYRPNADTEDIIYGAGTHAEPRIAALRALCELNQCLTWLPRPKSGDGRPMIDDPVALSWWKTARLTDCSWLAPPAETPLRSFSGVRPAATTDTLEDIEHYRAVVEAKGLEFLVLDQTRPDISMPVVRVIVPGMRHFWERLAPGRLYDVPVSQGHRTHPLAEHDINPAPVIA